MDINLDIGGNNNAPDPGGSTDGIIIDVGTTDFEEKVIKTSMQTPVIVDFWAPWCGPCKTLTPILEDEVKKAGGKVILAKVNMDDNQDLAQALQIQSIPTIYAFFQGQPVTGFAGAKPQSEIRGLVQELVKMAGAKGGQGVDIDQALSDAAKALSEKDFQTAMGLFSAVLQHDETNARAFAGLVRVYISLGQLKQARHLIEQAPDDIAKDPAFAEAQTALELAEQGGGANTAKLERKLAAEPEDHDTRFNLANGLYQDGRTEEAIDHLIEIIRRDREWQDGKAREQLLKFFEALGAQDPVTMQGRRKLSSVLFS